ncbi:hypothetical protein CcrC1_gp434 [Caulobacter phage C1]|nr:hypothetical protein CcrC1_gp434 [Caulobacter phage C1]UTU08663.1 hypothetical protein CcrC2_gp435 [Caulobacter phage C2]UTU09741.1 hypothetical protein CcrBL47_gp457 [Caulobacter phage BL47]UTU10295.1 hypothetical protein CcrRB23_gp433 [Caulobacter phage RB23]WGN97329.1 hypothetical protein [Bertelyvirus sp.]
MKFLRKLFGLCDHVWEKMQDPKVERRLVRGDYEDRFDTADKEDMVHVRTYHFQACLRCGVIATYHIEHERFPAATYKGDLSSISL